MIIKSKRPTTNKSQTPYATPKVNANVLKPLAEKNGSSTENNLGIKHITKITGQPLNTKAKGCVFFGVASWRQLLEKLENHMALSEAKYTYGLLKVSGADILLVCLLLFIWTTYQA